MSAETLWLFVLASAAIVVVPGPTVTVIVANSLVHGRRAGLLNVLGTQLGLALMVLVLALGFAVVVERLAAAFDVIRVLGAAYLVWLGWKLWRANGATLALGRDRGDGADDGSGAERGAGSGDVSPRRGWPAGRAAMREDGDGAGASAPVGRAGAGYVLQGFLVIWSNPKALFFFGAFLPQFVDPTRPAAAQVLLLGALFMLVGTLLDGAWALLAAGFADRFGRRHARLVERASGTCLAGGGLWLLAAGRGA